MKFFKTLSKIFLYLCLVVMGFMAFEYIKPQMLYQSLQGATISQSTRGSSVDDNPIIRAAINEIHNSDGVIVSAEEKGKGILKFGINRDVDAGVTTTIADFGILNLDNEEYATTNSIEWVVSSDANDTQEVYIEGHTISEGNLTFLSQTTTLNGQTPVRLSTPMYRSTRSANVGSTELSGEVYIFSTSSVSGGVPTIATSTHLVIPKGENQSQKAATSLSSTDYWIITGFCAGIYDATSGASVIVQLQIREPNGVFRTRAQVALQASGTSSYCAPFNYLIAKPNSDIRLISIPDVNNVQIVGSIDGYLASIQ